MKHINKFESYTSLFEAEMPEDVVFMKAVKDFDPEKAKKAAEEYRKHVKGGTEDADKTGLKFPNIMEVFGAQYYNLRGAIAQALFLAGDNLFPTNSYHSKDIQDWDMKMLKTTMSYYIGEGWQNDILKKVPVETLRAIKHLALLVYSDFSKYTIHFVDSSGRLVPQYTLAQMRSWPEVKEAATALKGKM